MVCQAQLLPTVMRVIGKRPSTPVCEELIIARVTYVIPLLPPSIAFAYDLINTGTPNQKAKLSLASPVCWGNHCVWQYLYRERRL
jgi:hypothetical protein